MTSTQKLTIIIVVVIFLLGYSVVLVEANTQEVDTQGEVIEEAPPEEETPATTGGGVMPPEWLMPPKAPEGGFRILINNGAEYTDNLIVNLTLFGGPDTARMAISNFSDFRDAGQESYTTEKKWDLCKGRISCPEGKYTVYVKFYAPWGQASEVVSDNIIYRKPILETIIEQIQAKINEISRKIADLRKQIAQFFFRKEVTAETPEILSEEISSKEAPFEKIIPPVEELLREETVTPPEEIFPEKEKEIIEPLKNFVKQLWQKIIGFWQRFWLFIR